MTKYGHWKAALLSILEYLKDTSDSGITFQQGNGIEPGVFVDADYTSKATDKRPISGGIYCAAVQL